MNLSELKPIYGVILAGGLARRFGGGDKSLRQLGERPILAYVIERLRPQVTGLLLNANGDPTRFRDFGLEVAADSISDRPGPLAGILAGLDWVAAHRPAIGWILTAPADCPFLPTDLLAQLAIGIVPPHRAAVVRYQQRLQPATGLWSVSLRHELRTAIVGDGLRRVEDWVERCGAVPVDFAPCSIDPFFNVNTPEDLELAKAFLK